MIEDAIKELNIRAKEGIDSLAQSLARLGLDADVLTQSFASRGEAARDAFKQVIAALEMVEDRAKRNRIGVDLFGTLFEDLVISI